MTDCSVADQCAFDALPDDVQALARRVLVQDETEIFEQGYISGALDELRRPTLAVEDSLSDPPQHETDTRASSAERSPVVGRCCIDAYVLGWDECNDEYQAQRVPSNHDVAARIAESRDDD